MTSTDARSAYTAGLRALADILEANPNVRLPYEGTMSALSWGVYGTHVPEGAEIPVALADLARVLIPGIRTKTIDDTYYRLEGNLHGLKVEVWGFRDAVCTRRVTGTREVVEEVPDPDALAAVPTVTVTRTEDVVEWTCEPLLAAEQAAVVSA